MSSRTWSEVLIVYGLEPFTMYTRRGPGGRDSDIVGPHCPKYSVSRHRLRLVAILEQVRFVEQIQDW